MFMMIVVMVGGEMVTATPWLAVTDLTMVQTVMSKMKVVIMFWGSNSGGGSGNGSNNVTMIAELQHRCET